MSGFEVKLSGPGISCAARDKSQLLQATQIINTATRPINTVRIGPV